MKLIIPLVLLITSLISNELYAYQANSDYILHKDGSKEFGKVDLTSLESDGTIFFTKLNSDDIKYGPEDILGFARNGGVVYYSKLIEYVKEGGNEENAYFFTVSIVTGTVSLEKVLSAPFEYAVTKTELTKALQREIPGSEFSTKPYRGVLYITFFGCGELQTNSLKYSESTFIYYVNEYNRCIDPLYENQASERIQYNRIEIEIKTGNKYSNIRFESFPLADPEVKYTVTPESNVTRFYGADMSGKIYKSYFVGVGLETSKYEFRIPANEDVRRFNSINFGFTEWIFKGTIGKRFELNKFSGYLNAHVNYHSIIEDYDRSLIIRVERKEEPEPTSSLRLGLKRVGDLPAGYVTYGISPSVFYELTKFLDLGISFTLHTTTKNIFSRGIDETTDYLNVKSLSISAKLKIINLK